LAAAAGDELVGSFDERYEHGLGLILAGLNQSLLHQSLFDQSLREGR
jgi:hypothetical protein